MASFKKNNSKFGLNFGTIFTLNVKKGCSMSLEGLSIPSSAQIESSNKKICSIMLKNNIIQMKALEKGEATLSVIILGVTVPGQVKVKVWE